MVARCKKCLHPVLGHTGRTGMNFCTATPLKTEEFQDASPIYVEDDDGSLPHDQMSREQLMSLLSGQSQTIDALKKEATKNHIIPPGSLGAAAGGVQSEVAVSLAEELMKKNKVSEETTAQDNLYQGPKMPDLRRDAVTTSMADQIMEQILARNPWLNPRGQVFGGAQSSEQGQDLGRNITNCVKNNGSIMGNTKVCTEPQPHLYLSHSSTSYMGKVTEKNINLPCFALGYLNYLIAVCDGRQNKISSSEFMARMHGLANILEIVVTNSSSTDHQSTAWQIARDYSNRVFTDVEQGKKTWESMSSSLQTESYILAKDHLEVSLRSSKAAKPQYDNSWGKDPKKVDKKSLSVACHNYNSVQNEGNVCAWELSNPGMRCNRLHVCSHCFSKGTQKCHRALECKSKNGAADSPPFHDGE